MTDLISRVPSDVFWTAVVFWFLGGLTVWRFAYYLERFRDAVGHARHHYARAVEFVRYARNNVVGLAVAGVVVLGLVGGIGLLAYLRLTGQAGG